MTGIAGQYYDGRNSAAHPARLSIKNHELHLQIDGAEPRSFPLEAVDISSRLGNTPRCFTLPDGSRFETTFNQQVDALLRRQKVHPAGGLIHLLESRLRYVFLALVLTLAFAWLLLQYGVPAGAKMVAMQLPVVSYSGIAEKVLDQLDSQFLQPTTLPVEVRERLEGRFRDMVADNRGSFDFQLLFRQGGRQFGANAFALPSGLIVMTDELVNLAENDDELVAVLAHEIGHVVHRHGLRQVLQNSVIMLAITYATGDVASVILAFPAMLVQMGYSREFEREADQFAMAFMRKNAIDPSHFAHILLRLETSQRAERKQGPEHHAEQIIYRYLSTHPETEQRIIPFLQESG